MRIITSKERLKRHGFWTPYEESHSFYRIVETPDGGKQDVTLHLIDNEITSINILTINPNGQETNLLRINAHESHVSSTYRRDRRFWKTSTSELAPLRKITITSCLYDNKSANNKAKKDKTSLEVQRHDEQGIKIHSTPLQKIADSVQRACLSKSQRDAKEISKLDFLIAMI